MIESFRDTVLRERCVIRPKRPRQMGRPRNVPETEDRIAAALLAARERRCRCGGDHTKTDLHAALWLVQEHYERIEHVSHAGREKPQAANP